MKKILIAAAVVAAAVALAACGGRRPAAEVDGDALQVKIENCNDPDSLPGYVDRARARAMKLVQEGRIDEARRYLDKITPAVKKKAPGLVQSLETVRTAIDRRGQAVSDSVRETAGAVVDSVKSKSEALKDAAVDKATDVVNSAKDAGEKALDASKKAASDAADKADEAIQKALGK